MTHFVRRFALVTLLAAGALTVPAALPAGEPCVTCGTLAGSIKLEKAWIETEGAKHARDVVVMLDPVDASAVPSSEARASMDQRGLVFVPHVLAVQKGTTVSFLNNDNDQHNVYFLDDRTGDTLDIGTWGPGVSVDHTFEEAGIVITLCKLHLEMAAFVVVTETPWFAQVQLDPGGSSGSFRLEGVPAGQYRLRAWHKKLKQKGGAAAVSIEPGVARDVEVVLTKARFAGGSS